MTGIQLPKASRISRRSHSRSAWSW